MATTKFFYTDKPNEPNIWAEEGLPYFCETGLPQHKEPINSKIYVMYHGTTVKAAESILLHGFRQSEDGILGRGVYVNREIDKAFGQPLDKKHVVLKLRVNVGKSARIDRFGHPLQKTWHSRGFDTAWIPPRTGVVESGLEKDCVWDPSRIKVVDVISAPVDHKVMLQNLLKRDTRG